MIEAPERTDPPMIADERPMLETWLDWQRATLATKCAGLTDAQLRERAVPPSSLSLLGLLRHMTEVERGWFCRALAGEETQPLYYSDDRPDDDFDDIEHQDPAEAYEIWNEACRSAREKVAAVDSLDAPAKRRQSNGEGISLRWIMVHMIEEYARHNGHADFLRERLDGATGD